jgi:hypothetical protein
MVTRGSGYRHRQRAIAVSIARITWPRPCYGLLTSTGGSIALPKNNAVQNGVETRIRFMIGNLLETVAGEKYVFDCCQFTLHTAQKKMQNYLMR